MYLGSFVYKKTGGNLTLESAPFGEGRFIATTTGFVPHYFLRDHLGSVRAVVNEVGEVLEHNDYYPLGMRWNGDELSDNSYRYNGKEEQNFVNVPYLDYGARIYDPRRGGWMTQDFLLAHHSECGAYEQCGSDLDPVFWGFRAGRQDVDLCRNQYDLDRKILDAGERLWIRKSCCWNWNDEIFANFRISYAFEVCNGTMSQRDVCYRGADVINY